MPTSLLLAWESLEGLLLTSACVCFTTASMMFSDNLALSPPALWVTGDFLPINAEESDDLVEANRSGPAPEFVGEYLLLSCVNEFRGETLFGVKLRAENLPPLDCAYPEEGLKPPEPPPTCGERLRAGGGGVDAPDRRSFALLLPDASNLLLADPSASPPLRQQT